MEVSVRKIEKEHWGSFSEDAHRICFDERKDPTTDRIDYALLAVADDSPLGYVTVRELDADTVYWQFGGAFPTVKNTVSAFKAYQSLIAWQSERCKRITTMIENTNTVMLKFAMKAGFRISGVRLFKGAVLVEHLLEFNHG